MPEPDIFDCIITALKVRHTPGYSRRAYAHMPFRTLFGLTKLLESYGVDSATYRLAHPETDIDRLPLPFLARMGDTFALVSCVSPEGVQLDYGEGDGNAKVPRSSFAGAFTGVVTLFQPRAGAAEPDYAKHRFFDIADKAKKAILALAAVFIAVWCFVRAGLYASVPAWFLLAADIAGLYVTYLLFLKSHGFNSRHGDSICGVIDRSGCHTVLGTSAAKFLGLFGWSEVGLGYFSVSTASLLLFPATAPWLALINACACPFSFWSVWYQKYRAKAWCTLCLITQVLLWVSLSTYILGGYFADLRLAPGILPLLAAYLGAVLGINAVGNAFDSLRKDSENG